MTLAIVIVSFCFAFLLAWGLNRLALRPWRRSLGQHWTERARLLYPAQKSAGQNGWLIPVVVGVLSYVLWPDVDFILVVIPSYAGSLVAGYLMRREVFPDLRLKSWLHLIAAGLFLFVIRWVVLIFAIINIPDNFGYVTWIMAAGVLLLLLAFVYGLGIRLLIWFHLLQPATEHLNALVQEVSGKMGVPVRSTWILTTYISNAFVLPFSKQLIFTSKLLAASSDEEIKAVCAHELGHLNEPGKVLFMRLLVSMSFFPLIFARPLGSLGDNGTSAFWILLIGVLLIWLLGIRLSRRMESRADKIAKEYTAEAAVYARALERLYETNQTPAVMPFSSHKIHPDLYDRMIAAGVTPDYPKPKPPKGRSWTSNMLLAVLILIPLILFCLKILGAIVDVSTVHVQ